MSIVLYIIIGIFVSMVLTAIGLVISALIFIPDKIMTFRQFRRWRKKACKIRGTYDKELFDSNIEEFYTDYLDTR